MIIPSQKPKAARFEQWPAGVPGKIVGAKEGAWTDSKEGKASTSPNNEVCPLNTIATSLAGLLKSPTCLDALNAWPNDWRGNGKLCNEILK